MHFVDSQHCCQFKCHPAIALISTSIIPLSILINNNSAKQVNHASIGYDHTENKCGEKYKLFNWNMSWITPVFIITLNPVGK